MKLPRMPRGKPTVITVLLVLLAMVTAAVAWIEQSGWLYVWLPGLSPPAPTSGEPAALVKVSDGDTVKLRYHDLLLTVRLRNVDTEESVHSDASRNTDFGRETSQWVQDYLAGTRVWVAFERRRWRIDTDHHGRALGMLWISRGAPGPDDDELFNETLIRQGYSAYITTYGHAGRYHRRLQRAQEEAQEEQLGMWSR